MRIPALILLLTAACATFPVNGSNGSVRTQAAVDVTWVADVEIPKHMVRPTPVQEQRLARAIEALGARDFATFSAAAREVVEFGETAVPYLGHAESLDEPNQRIPITLCAVLKASPPRSVGLQLGSRYASVRRAAADTAGERRLTDLAPALVDLLEDEDERVRRAGVTALRKITNRFYGYRADASATKRAKAAAEWRKLWS